MHVAPLSMLDGLGLYLAWSSVHCWQTNKDCSCFVVWYIYFSYGNSVNELWLKWNLIDCKMICKIYLCNCVVFTVQQKMFFLFCSSSNYWLLFYCVFHLILLAKIIWYVCNGILTYAYRLTSVLNSKVEIYLKLFRHITVRLDNTSLDRLSGEAAKSLFICFCRWVTDFLPTFRIFLPFTCLSSSLSFVSHIELVTKICNCSFAPSLLLLILDVYMKVIKEEICVYWNHKSRRLIFRSFFVTNFWSCDKPYIFWTIYMFQWT